MSNSFTIKFEFTDLEKVYNDDRSSGINDRRRFFKDLLIEIWDLNRLIGSYNGSFPLYKLTVESDDDFGFPALEMCVPETIMKTFEDQEDRKD